MDPILLASYRAEYLADPRMELKTIQMKYNLSEADIAGWDRLKPNPNPISEAQDPKPKPEPVPAKPLVPEPIVPDTEPVLPPQLVIPSDFNAEEEEAKIKTKATFLKSLLLDEATNLLGAGLALDTKELRDIMTVVTGIDGTNKVSGGSTVQVLVQNLMERFQDDV